MNFLTLRRYASHGVDLTLFALLLLGTGGCGSSSNSSNGNTTAISTTGTTGNTGDPNLNGGGFWIAPPGTPLSNTALPTGTWEGYYATDTGGPAVLTVSSSGTRLTLFCTQTAQFSQPIVLDKTGSFVTQGTGSLSSSGTGAVYLSGQVAVSTVNGKSVTNLLLYVGNAPSDESYGVYDMTLGSTYAEGACR